MISFPLKLYLLSRGGRYEKDLIDGKYIAMYDGRIKQDMLYKVPSDDSILEKLDDKFIRKYVYKARYRSTKLSTGKPLTYKNGKHKI